MQQAISCVCASPNLNWRRSWEQKDILEEFKASLIANDNATVVNDFFVNRPSVVLGHECELQLHQAIAGKFEISVGEVITVGSSKMGFTLQDKTDRPCFSDFGDTSDIDIAIISRPLFEHYWKYAFEYWTESSNWEAATQFKKYLFRGWLRPDKLPSGGDFDEATEWFEFFRQLTASGDFGPYKIAAGVYYDEYFWQSYMNIALDTCRTNLELGV